MALKTFSAVKGIEFILFPVALQIALVIATGTTARAISPSPRTPN